MSQVEMNAYEAVLRMCADAAPNAWHPQQYSRRSGTPLEQINAVLKQLWDRGLLERGPAHSEYGPGLRLSNRGWEVLNDPTSLRRLCDSAVNMPADDGPNQDPQRTAEVIDSLRTKRVAYVSWTLLGINVLVFLAGLYLAFLAGVPMAYLGGIKTLYAAAVFVALFVAFNVRPFAQYFNTMMRIVILIGVMYLANQYQLFRFPVGGAADAIRHQCGLLSALDWVRGEWWRALTACFVHLGLLHLLGNMLMLYSGGWFIERMWGHGRFLVIYLLAGITGSLTGLASSPGGIAGASGALCGLIAAEAMWVVFNGKYLPRRMQQEWWNNLSLNCMLLVAISFVPGVSFWGHAGGALAGAAAAVCLHYQRVGAPLWRWATLLGLFPIPLAALFYLDHERQTQAVWQLQTLERSNFEQGYKHSLAHPLTKDMASEFTETVRPVLVDKRAGRRTDGEIEAALTVLDKHHKELESWRAELARLGPYESKKVKEDRQQALDAVTARLELCERAERSLREGENYPEKDEKELMALIADTPELRRQDDRPIAVVKKPEETEEERQEREKRQQAAEAKRKQKEAVAREEGEFNDELLPKIARPLRSANNLYEDDLTALLDRPVAERVPQTLKKNLAAIDDRLKQLQQLADWLPTLGPFMSEDVTKAIAVAKAYETGLAKLLELAKHGLEAGEKWTDEEKAELKKQDERVTGLRKAWRDLLE